VGCTFGLFRTFEGALEEQDWNDIHDIGRKGGAGGARVGWNTQLIFVPVPTPTKSKSTLNWCIVMAS
jgi:hypothetical protein